MSLVTPRAEVASASAESNPVVFEDAVKRVEAKERFEQRARELRQGFDTRCVEQITRFEVLGGTSVKASKRVGGPALANYVTGVGELVEQASAYEWEDDSPALRVELQSLAVQGACSLIDAALPALEFTDVYMEGDLDVSRARFLGPVAMKRTAISGAARFAHAELRGLTLSQTLFSGDVGFEFARADGFSAFHECHFSRKADFSGAQFEAVSFGVVFGDNVSFSDASFSLIANWENTRFDGESEFSRACFFAPARFNNGKFLKSASFAQCSFVMGADFGDVEFVNKASFSGARFSGAAGFLNTRFKNETLFTGARFSVCPRFHGTEVHQDTSFGQTRMMSMSFLARPRALWVRALLFWQHRHTRPRPGARYPGPGGGGASAVDWNAEARAYRTLKLHMTKHQAQHEASRFFAGEMRCRRREYGLSQPVQYIVSLLYDLFSEFGQSTGRVLLWLALANGAFTYGYYTQAQQDACALQPSFALIHTENAGGGFSAWDETRPWLALSLQSLNPVAFLSPKNTWVRVYDGRVFLAGAGQSLANLTLIVLLGISLRGQFRRGGGGGD